MSGTVLVLGATGRFGRHVSEAFWNRGWQVRLYERNSDDLLRAAMECDVIVNGWNPPYHHWAREVPQLTSRVIDAARASGATVIVPGNVYVYGKDAPEVLTEATPHRADNPLGRIRREMETAYKRSGVRVILLRAGDFIDTEASGNWFDRVITARQAKRGFSYPGYLNAPHAWAFLPDLAAAAVALAERREELETFTEVNFPGYTLTGAELAKLCSEALGREMRVSRMNWLPIRLASPFWPMARHLLEMRYLWNMPHRLDGTRFDMLLSGFRGTDPATAIARALAPEIDPDKPVASNGAAVTA